MTFSLDLHYLKTQRESWKGKEKKKKKVGREDNNPFLFPFKQTDLTQQAAKQYRPAFPLLSPAQQEPSTPQTVQWWEPYPPSQLGREEASGAHNQWAWFRDASGAIRDWQDSGRRGKGSQLGKEEWQVRAGESNLKHPQPAYCYSSRGKLHLGAHGTSGVKIRLVLIQQNMRALSDL